jgi:FkbM family methyltransferase
VKCVHKVWLPDEEDEIAKFLRAEQDADGVGLYQHHKMQAALSHCTQFRTAIDIGGHVGTWSMRLAKQFERVFAFEPIERHRECFALNAPSVALLPYALGDKDGTAKLAKGVKSTGDTCISPDGEYSAEVKRLDDFDIDKVDFIKMDCEGYELFVCRGGEQTIQKWHPVIIVEQKPGKAQSYGLGDTEAVKWLEERGYKLKGVIAGDYILA